MKKIGVLLIAIALVASACGGEPVATPTTLPPAATQPQQPASTPAPSAAEHIDRGQEYYLQDDLEKAAAEFRAALELEPDNAAAHSYLGAVYDELGQSEQAIIELELAIELSPSYAGAHANLCTAYVRIGEIDKALAACQKAIQLDPTSALAHNSLGVVHLNQNNPDEAEREFKEAVKLDHDYSKAHSNLGMIYASQGRYDDAVFELKEAIRTDENDPIPHYNLGNCYKDMDKLEDAIAEYQEALRVDPNYAAAHYNLGTVYEAQGKTDEAIAEFQAYLQLEPDSPQRAAVEAEIAKLQGGSQATLTAEYTDLYGGYSLRHPADWSVSQDDLGVVVLSQAGSSEPDALFLIIARPLSFYEHEAGVDELTTLDQFAAAAVSEFKVDSETLTSASVAGVPALVGNGGELIGDQAGQIVLFVARGMGYVIVPAAKSDAWTEFEPVGMAMLDSFTLVGPQVTAEYTNQAADYSLRYPDGWVVTEEDTFVGLTPLAGLQPNDAPYVALFAGQEQIADAFNVEGEFSTDNIIAGFIKATQAQSKRLEPGTVGGQVGTAAEMAFEVDGVRVEGLLVVFEQAEPPLVLLLAVPASQGDSFAETFSQILASLTFSQPAAGSSVDQSDPAKVVQAVFDAAQTQSFVALASLCDPQGQNDKDTATICAMTADHSDKDSFVTYFAKGKINGEVAVSGDRAQVPFLFGPNGDQQETMSLIQRDGKWYLLEF